MKWNSRNKKYYEDKGYTYTKMKDEFEVLVTDLPKYSAVLVTVNCDYCGKTYAKEWYRYSDERQNLQNDCCISCRKFKIKESVEKTYGENNVFKVPAVKNKISETNIKKYGCANPFASDEIKAKIVKTNISKYGTKNPIQSSKVQEKVKATCRERYGVDYFIQTQHFAGADSPVWKGGVARQRSERFTYDYRKWRTLVYQRDGYTCQCCGAHSHKGRTVDLNAHHIFNWSDYPELRYDIDNGITLCEDCHNLFHKLFGKKNVTKTDFDKFLNTYGKKIC